MCPADLAKLLYISVGVLSSAFVRKFWVRVIRVMCATGEQLTFWERVNPAKILWGFGRKSPEALLE